MDLFYGNYRSLEEEFDTYVSALAAGPQRPVLVLCPSGRVAEYLRARLVKKNGFISNVFFCTLTQLLSTLDQERPGPHVPLLPADSLHDYILKNLLEQPSLNLYGASRGFISALKTSLLDLADSLAEADVLEEYARTITDPALAEEQAHLLWLVKTYRAYQAQMRQIPGFRSYQQYFEDALAQAENSAWLKGFTHIIFYGFYELTGRQLELFHTICGHYPVTTFWCYSKENSFSFGYKFFVTNVMGAAANIKELTPPSKVAAGDISRVLFTSASVQLDDTQIPILYAADPPGELFAVAKEIQRLHTEQGIAFEDIAVTARSLAAYQVDLPEIFAQNHIPLKADFSYALSEKPFGIFLINLLSLGRRGFDREDILAVVNSPYFKQNRSWRYLIEECLAERDYAQWTDLVRPGLKNYDPAFLTWLESVNLQTARLEKADTWDTLCTAAEAFLKDNVCTEKLLPAEQKIWEQVLHILNRLKRYQNIYTHAKEHEFLEELLAALQQIQVHEVQNVTSGVTVVDVPGLRGLSFKVVFVLGMNEKSFPQLIREDPVLKDYYRRILREQLGYWINQKMERFEEEKLLFAVTLQAAQEKIYLCWARADGSQKPLVWSSYLLELLRATGWNEAVLKRNFVEKEVSARWHNVDFSYLTAKEVSLSLALHGAEKTRYEQAKLLTPLKENSLDAAQFLSKEGKLGKYDGMIESGEEIFAQQNTTGFSPSALQDLAHCPMKYFFAKGLHLQEPEEPLSRSALAPNLRGSVYHRVLMQYYQYLYQNGLHRELFDTARKEYLQRALHECYPPENYKSFGIYPVIWQLILKEIEETLADFVCKDGAQLGDYIPSIFETFFEKCYSPSPDLQIKLKGIIDRIDVDSQHHTFRVLDYKSSTSGRLDLAGDIFKKVILQPLIYLILAQGAEQTKGLQPDGAALLVINKEYKHCKLSQSSFEALSEKAEAFFTLLMQIIKQGTFFISLNKNCEYCCYQTICRRDCYHTLLRVRQSAVVEPFEEVKQ